MPRWLKRLLIAIAVLVVLLAALVGGISYSALGGHTAIVDGAMPAPDVRIVKDDFVVVGVVDAGGGKILLIDAGNNPDGAPILAELKRRNLGPEAVAAIFLTHGHPDHLAAAHLFPKAALYALEADVALAQGLVGSHGPVSQLIPAKPTGLLAKGLHANDVVAVGDKEVRVFAVPGHTPGSAAYLVGGVLFLGDSAVMQSDGKLAGAPWVATDDSKQNHASLKSLADALRPEKNSIVAIVPAHSGMGQFADLDALVP